MKSIHTLDRYLLRYILLQSPTNPLVMKKLFSLALFYISILSLSIFLHSCCSNPEQVTIIGGGEIRFTQDAQLPISFENPVERDTITRLPLSLSTNMELLFAANFIDQGFISSAYGLSCDPEYQNSLVESTFSLSINQDFSYNGEAIAAGENFADLTEVFTSLGNEVINVTLNQNFMDRVEFTNGQTMFTINVRTTDDVEVESIGSVFIDM